MRNMNGDSRKNRVAYIYHGTSKIDVLDDIKNYSYGQDHPMRPKRVAMTHDMIDKYDMYHDLKVYVFQPPNPLEIILRNRRGDDGLPLP